jgi:serine/threonine protein kinase
MLDTYLTPSEEVAVKVTRLVPKVVKTAPKHANGKYAGQDYAYTGTPDSSSRAFDEFRILKNLSGHPNIIKVFNTFESDKHVYQVSEKCMGDLVDVARAVCVSEALLSQWAFQMISALSYAHERDVVHGDIKPDNILMRKDGTIAVSDWGFARDSSNQRSPHCKEFHGTDHYSPPEWLLQERGKSKEADVWGVGAVIFSVAYGKLPFGKVSRDNPESVKRVCVEPLSFYAEVRTASVALKLFISSMMAKKWRDRQQMKEFLRHPWLARETEIRTDINNIISVLSRPAAPDTAEQEGDQ